MGSDNESIGGISVQIVGNYAPLLEDIQEATTFAARGGAEIAEALTAGATGADALASSVASAAGVVGSFESQIQALVDSGSTLAEALASVEAATVGVATGVEETGAAAEQAAEQLNLFDEAISVPYSDAAGQLNMFATELEPIPGAAKSAAEAEAELAQETDHAGESAHHAAGSLGELGEKLVAFGEALAIVEGLKEFGEEAIKAADRVDDATLAIGALGKGTAEAKESIEKLRTLAHDEALSFPALLEASTRMTAFLRSSEQVPAILAAVGNSAAVMGTEVGGAARQFERVIASGQLSQRVLIGLGLSLGDVARAMNTTEAQAQEMFKSLDQSEKVEVMITALGKFSGMAAKLNDDATGAIHRLGLAFEEVMEDIGTALDPVIKKIADFGETTILPAIKAVTAAFKELPEPIREGAVVIGILAAAVVPVTLAIGGFGLALSAAGSALAPLLAGLSALGAGMTGAGASYTAMLATGIATAAIWVGLAAAIADVVIAYHAMASAEDLAAKSQADASRSLAVYETALRQHGIAIDALRKDYDAGRLTTEQYIAGLGKLRDEYLKTHPVIQDHDTATKAVFSSTEALRIKMTALADAVKTTHDQLAKVTEKYNEHKATAAEVAAAYDKWQGATAALKTAQTALLPVVTNVHHATRAFVETTREFPDAMQAAGNAIEGLQVKANLEALALGEAQRNLARLLKDYDALKVAYDNGNVSFTTFEAALKGVATAEDLVATKQAAVNKALGDLPTVTLKEYTAEMNKAGGAVASTIPALERWIGTLATSQHGMKDTVSILEEMGIKISETGDLVASKLIASYDELAGRNLTLEQEALAWGKISGAVNKLAQTDLPEALRLYDQHYAQITRAGASEAELLETQAKRLQLEIEIDGQSGRSATNQIIGLQNIKLAQGLLYDQTHLLGNLYVSVTNDILKGFDELGKSVADSILDSKNLGDAFIETGKKIGKTILEDIIGTYFKALKDEILKSTGLLNGLTTSLSKFFGLGKSGASAAGGIADDAAGPAVKGFKSSGDAAGGLASGGVLGIVGAVAGIGQLISSIVGNFQMAKMETTLNAVEHNTRFLEIVFEQYAQGDEWQRHGEILEALGNIFTRLGEVGVGVMQTVADVTDSIRQGFGGLVSDGGADKKHPAALDPYTFTGPDAIANGILNGLIRGNGPIPKMETGGPIFGDGLRYLHDGEFVVPRAGVPQMQGMSSPASARASSVSINAGSHTINIYEAANPRETARQVAEMLKILSPRFAPFAQ